MSGTGCWLSGWARPDPAVGPVDTTGVCAGEGRLCLG